MEQQCYYREHYRYSSRTITDNNGCTSVSSATITEPASVVASTAVDSNVSCNGFSDGGATASGTGGTMPYTYSWSNAATTASITGVAAGTYTVSITDANGCGPATSTVTITEPTALVASTIVDSNVTCNGFSDGGATASGTGGTMPYTYLWSNSATTASITGVMAGTYTVTVTDNNGCTATSSSSITEPTALTVVSSVSNNVSCNGGSDGAAVAFGSGGVMPYTYAWSSGETIQLITAKSAGTYTVTVTDANGCTDTANTTITEPAAVGASITAQTNVSCNGLSDGSATSSGSGGTSPYTYSWSTGATTASISSLSAGTYTVSVTDVNGCGPAIDSVIITEPVTLMANASVTQNVNCNGGSSASVISVPTGGTSPYTYNWSSGSTTDTSNNLVAGNYSVTVTDANGCTDVGGASPTEPAAVGISIIAQTNVACNGDTTGGFTIQASGGASPYQYSLDGINFSPTNK